MNNDHDSDDDITKSPSQSPSSRDRTASSPQRGRVEPAKPAARPTTGGNHETAQQPAPGRPGEGVRTDRSGKTYEGKTGVSGETSEGDDEI